MINVLCAELAFEELIPMIYTEWPSEYQSNTTTPNTITWPNSYNLTLPEALVPTAVDNLFNFGEAEAHPIFPKRPLRYNTVLNNSAYGPDSIYVLANSSTKTSALCSLRGGLYSGCFTIYNATSSGGQLGVQCSDHPEALSYRNSNPSAPMTRWLQDWVPVAGEWAMAVNLGDGISDGASTNARLLSQLVLNSPSLNPLLPSIGEALAVLAGNTLLLSALDAPFVVHEWNYTNSPHNILDKPAFQWFNATFSTHRYISGGSQAWQRIFLIVLVFVFAANIACFLYLVASDGLITDFMEPLNFFCLSSLSPASRALAGGCASGPLKEHVGTKWSISLNASRNHLSIESNSSDEQDHKKSHRDSLVLDKTTEIEMQTDIGRAYDRIRKNRISKL